MKKDKYTNSDYFKELVKNKDYGPSKAEVIMNRRKRKLGINFKELGEQLSKYLRNG